MQAAECRVDSKPVDSIKQALEGDWVWPRLRLNGQVRTSQSSPGGWSVSSTG